MSVSLEPNTVLEMVDAQEMCMNAKILDKEVGKVKGEVS